jgi:hypothetical protein
MAASWLAQVPLNRCGQTGAVWPEGQYPEYGIHDSNSEPDWVSEVDSLIDDQETALRDMERRRMECLKEKHLSAMRRDTRRRRQRDIQPMYEKEWRRRDKAHMKEIRHYHQVSTQARKAEERRKMREEMKEKKVREVENIRELWRRQQDEEQEKEKKEREKERKKEKREREKEKQKQKQKQKQKEEEEEEKREREKEKEKKKEKRKKK